MRIKKLTSSQLADSIGVQRSGISHFISGRNKPSLEFILKILNQFPDINPDWLLFGKDPVYRDGHAQLKNVEKARMPETSISVPEEDHLKDSQPSFLNELFSEQVEGQDKNQNVTADPVKNQRNDQGLTREQWPETTLQPVKLVDSAGGIKQKPDIEPGSTEEKTIIRGEENPMNETYKEEKPEKIVVFYKNRTFREYLPG